MDAQNWHVGDAVTLLLMHRACAQSVHIHVLIVWFPDLTQAAPQRRTQFCAGQTHACATDAPTTAVTG